MRDLRKSVGQCVVGSERTRVIKEDWTVSVGYYVWLCVCETKKGWWKRSWYSSHFVHQTKGL